MAARPGTSTTAQGNHFSCSLTAVLIARVESFGGPEAVAKLLHEAGSERSRDYLLDLGNWISYDEAVALWQAGARITRHPHFARVLGEDAARRLNGSPVAALLRSLGSPEEVCRQMATASGRFSTVTTLEAVKVGPGFAEIIATAVEGFPRDADHCEWTCGLLTQPSVLFGLPPAIVEHEECAALGAPCCRYRVIWDADAAKATADSTDQVQALRQQLEAMKERLHSMFVTASDLIAEDEIAGILARITDRAAVEVRAPKYLLAVRTTPGGDVLTHQKGFEEEEAKLCADRILSTHVAALPESWLVVHVRSKRRDYGRLLAIFEGSGTFFAEERELLEVYARYAASALDSATALTEAKQLHHQSSALLALARALATAGTSGEIALRLADAVPVVVDCDRVGVYLWDEARGEIMRRAIYIQGQGAESETDTWSLVPSPGGPVEDLLNNPRPEPVFIDANQGAWVLRDLCAKFGAVASILVPITTVDKFLGLLLVSVMDDAERLSPNADLLDRLSGVAAQATTALQNGHLLDQITHQALHDELTGLANRAQFRQDLRSAVQHARQHSKLVTVFYIDLDGFKPVNDEFGHEVGDRLLHAVGQRLTGCTRSHDTVARLGGDEFAVLMAAQATPPDAAALTHRLKEAFSSPFVVDGMRLHVGASVGRAEFPRDADTAEALLRVADVAMLDVKRVHHQDSPQLARGR